MTDASTSSTPLASKTLTASTKIYYGVADLGIAMLTASVQFFLLFFYTDVVIIDPGLAGTALLVGKLTWDAINDPLIGYLSDRTRTRIGRRRPYMLAGALPLAVSVLLLYSIPAGLSSAMAFIGILLTFLLFDTLHTLVSVPYYAMTPELTQDYDERSGLTAVRMVFSVVGYILGAAATTALAAVLQDAFDWTEAAAYSGMGLLFGLVAAVCVFITAAKVRERSSSEIQPSKMPPLDAIKQTFRNRPFIQLVAAFFVSSFSFTLMTSLLPFYLTYQLDMEDQVPLVLLVMLVTIGIFLFPWIWISDRINKGPTYALGLFIACVAVIATFFLPYGATPVVYLIAFVAGLGFSAQWVFPWSMLPDVIEVDELQTGERREGIFYGIWALLTKLTAALGIAVSGWALDLFGYVPNVAQTETARLGIRLFFGLIPSIAIILSLPLLIWYPITRRTHAEIREVLTAAETTLFSEP